MSSNSNPYHKINQTQGPFSPRPSPPASKLYYFYNPPQNPHIPSSDSSPSASTPSTPPMHTPSSSTSSSRSASPVPAGEPGTCTIFSPNRQPGASQLQAWVMNRNKAPPNDPVGFIESCKYTTRGLICYDCGKSKEWADITAGVVMRGGLVNDNDENDNTSRVLMPGGGNSVGDLMHHDKDKHGTAKYPATTEAHQRMSENLPPHLPVERSTVGDVHIITNSVTVNRFSDPGPTVAAAAAGASSPSPPPPPPPIPPRRHLVPELLQHRIEQFKNFQHAPGKHCKPDRAGVVGIWENGELARDTRDWTQFAVDVQFALMKPKRREKWMVVWKGEKMGE
ncbi:hypothetical protein BZA77DRAFT_295835 [Pyronema omphalodes]|nr:hypothetical protein BZA77DRAFT_295835 [Pyronema omphalodes]